MCTCASTITELRSEIEELKQENEALHEAASAARDIGNKVFGTHLMAWNYGVLCPMVVELIHGLCSTNKRKHVCQMNDQSL